MSAESPLVYLILGAAGSGRREVVRDLIAEGLPEEARPVIMAAAREMDGLAGGGPTPVGAWSLADGVITAEPPPDAGHVFWLSDGRKNPVDQVEAFKVWLGQAGAELGRIICVVNCRLAEAHPPMLAWYDACIHFSDVVLLNHREGVSNKWLSDFQQRYRKQFYPCLFEMVKQGRVKNAAVLLEPEARRISQVFDAEQEWVVTDEEGEEVVDEEGFAVEPDPYLARRAGGRRVKEIPDVTQFLGAT